MFTEPKVILTENLKNRGYITYYYNGKRYREYNGKKLNLEINPNQGKGYNDRLRLLKTLSNAYYKVLLKGWTPEIEVTKSAKEEISIKDALENIRQEKLASFLSNSYKTDLSSVLSKFFEYINPILLNQNVSSLHECNIDGFLSQFKSSATYYMNRRRALNVYFVELLRSKLISINPIDETKRLKKTHRLHKIYDSRQLKQILEYLKSNYPNLHICALLAYGCFLRPHQEIRLLTLGHFNKDFTLITLSGSENKSKRIRVVNVPDYVKEEIQTRLAEFSEPCTNILSLNSLPYNLSYLNTQWSRAKKG